MRRAPRRVRFPKRAQLGTSQGRGFAVLDSQDSWQSPAPVPAYPGMGKGKGSTIGPRSIAGGSAKGKGSNPRCTDGEVMQCHGCGSTEHLVSRCPHRKGKGRGGQCVSFTVPEVESEPKGTTSGVTIWMSDFG